MLYEKTLIWSYTWRFSAKKIEINELLDRAVAQGIKNQIKSADSNGVYLINGRLVKEIDVDVNYPQLGIIHFVANLQEAPKSFFEITSDINIIVKFDDGTIKLKKDMQERDASEIKKLIDSEIEFNPYQFNSIFFQNTIRDFDSLILLNKKEILDELIQFLSPEDSIEAWSRRTYGQVIPLVNLTKSKSPVFVFAGDPGTGKTALAKSIGAAVSNELKVSVNTWLISIALRGVGYQGRAATMVTQLFNYARSFIQSNQKPLLIVFDEAEAMVGSRKNAGNGDGAQENIAIVNAILRGIDQLVTEKYKASVIFISNIPMNIDEALMRRCSYYWFPRPDDNIRKQIFAKCLNGLNFSDVDIQELVDATNPKIKDGNYFKYTASDIVTVILYKAITICAKQGKRLDKQTILDVCKESYPTGFPRVSVE